MLPTGFEQADPCLRRCGHCDRHLLRLTTLYKNYIYCYTWRWNVCLFYLNRGLQNGHI